MCFYEWTNTSPSVQMLAPFVQRGSGARVAGYQSRRVSKLCDIGEEST
jgi:hypothetical protein